MTPLEAEHVVNKYGEVLERTSSILYGVPETLLPFDRDVIKHAISVILAFLKSNPNASGEDIAQYIEQLKTGYASLAEFVSVEDASIGAAANAALLSGNVNHPNWGLVK